MLARLNQLDNQPWIDLAGPWLVQLDRDDIGEQEHWCQSGIPRPDGELHLPDSIQHAGFGDAVGVDTRWVGSLFDRSWYLEDRFESYRQPGNIHIPFWLQPDRAYQGVAWCERTLVIPEAWVDLQVILFLERCHWFTQAWVNGHPLGSRESLALPHTYELPEGLTGECKLVLRVDNRIHVDVGPNAHCVSDHVHVLPRYSTGIAGPVFLRDRAGATPRPPASFDPTAPSPASPTVATPAAASARPACTHPRA